MVNQDAADEIARNLNSWPLVERQTHYLARTEEGRHRPLVLRLPKRIAALGLFEVFLQIRKQSTTGGRMKRTGT